VVWKKDSSLKNKEKGGIISRRGEIEIIGFFSAGGN
jgi:hypothetical protein